MFQAEAELPVESADRGGRCLTLFSIHEKFETTAELKNDRGDVGQRFFQWPRPQLSQGQSITFDDVDLMDRAARIERFDLASGPFRRLWRRHSARCQRPLWRAPGSPPGRCRKILRSPGRRGLFDS